ncbi:MAG: hypothetical protein ACOC9D_04340 [Thermodesulfobacteriota bacterium]
MPLISESCLNRLDLDPLGPQDVMEQLRFFPEFFPFLQRHEEIMGRLRPVITYLVAATVWAFRAENHKPKRELENGFLDSFWARLAEGRGGIELPDVLQEIEPNMWDHFLTLVRAASDQENWTAQELAVASKIYGTILLVCELIFCDEEDLLRIENLFKLPPEGC